MTEKLTIDELVQETSDLLDAGAVGLYEMTWSTGYSAADPADLEVLREATARLLEARPEARLQWRFWPFRFDRDETRHPRELPAEAWVLPPDDSDESILEIVID